MATNILTDRALKSDLALAQAAAKAKNTRIKVRDGNNLILVVRPNGMSSWVLEYRTATGQRKPHTLGPWPAMGLASARKAAEAGRSLIAQGVDLNSHKKGVKVAAIQKAVADTDTVKQLFEDFMSKKSASDVYVKNIRAAFIADVLPEIGVMRPQDVTRADILKILRTIEARGSAVMLRRVRMWLKHVFEYGVVDVNYLDRSATTILAGGSGE